MFDLIFLVTALKTSEQPNLLHKVLKKKHTESMFVTANGNLLLLIRA